MTRILHPTDFSPNAAAALEQAIRLALVRSAIVDILHLVLERSEDTARAEASMSEYIGRARARAAEWSAGSPLEGKELEITTTVERAVSAYEGVMERVTAVPPDLIVLGTHGRSGLSHLLMGSQAEKILRHAPCSVMTLRTDAAVGGGPDGFERVLVGIDFSEDSGRALELARTLLSPSVGRLTLLHVVAPVGPVAYTGDVRTHLEADPDLPATIEQRVRQVAGPGAYDVVITEGPPAREIMRVADEAGADVIVVGGRGLTGWERMLVGSVTERIVRFARRPVLTVR